VVQAKTNEGQSTEGQKARKKSELPSKATGAEGEVWPMMTMMIGRVPATRSPDVVRTGGLLIVIQNRVAAPRRRGKKGGRGVR